MLTKRDKALKAFYERFARSHLDFTSMYSQPLGISRASKILRMLAIKPEDVVCDMGCGDGYIASQARRESKKVNALDISETRAKRVAVRGIDAICADVQSMPFKNEQFDKVICSEVMEHVINHEAILYEIARVMKSNGKAVLAVPLNQVLVNTLLNVPDKELECLDYEQIKIKYKLADTHVHSYIEKALQELIERCGLKLDETDYTYVYTLRLNIFPKFLLTILRFPLTQLGERMLQIPFCKVYTRLLFFVLYKEGPSRCHIISRVRKC